MTVPERWVDANRVAEHFEVTAETVRIWAKTGEIPYARVGKFLRFRIGEIEKHFSRPRDPWSRGPNSPTQRRWIRNHT